MTLDVTKRKPGEREADAEKHHRLLPFLRMAEALEAVQQAGERAAGGDKAEIIERTPLRAWSLCRNAPAPG